MECEALHVLVQASLSVPTKSLVGLISCPGLQSEHSNYSLEPPSCFSSQYPLCMKYCYLPFPTLLSTDCALNTVLTLLTVSTTQFNKKTHQLASSSSTITSCLDLLLPITAYNFQSGKRCSLFFVYPLSSIQLPSWCLFWCLH